MPAIITKKLKRKFAQQVFDEVRLVSNRYYIGIGKAEPYDSSETVTTPLDSKREDRNLRAGLQSMKSAQDCSYVIPRYNWISGTKYQGFDDAFETQPASNSYYVLTEDNQVYVCLKPSKDSSGVIQPSTVKPTGTSVKAFKLSDGYVWKYLYTMAAANANKFLSANFLPVQLQLDSTTLARSLEPLEVLQENVQNAAVPGQILGIAMINNGTGYVDASPPTVTIQGDGDSTPAITATVSGGSITKIELDSSADSAMQMGRGFDFASVLIPAPDSAGGIQATARVILGPDSGLGADARTDLLSTSLMFNTKPSGNENNDFIVGNDFRQVGLFRNPRVFKGNAGADSALDVASGRAIRYLLVTSSVDAADFTADTTITGQTSGAKGIIDEVVGDKIYFHQTETTGFHTFAENETISGGGEDATTVAAGLDANARGDSADDIKLLSGELLYIENRAPVTRSTDQTEDIKVVITL
tara:strand:+ start:243 stop:1655 length:1413 start_codon:yes stop_codon:yes gene_type:complete